MSSVDVAELARLISRIERRDTDAFARLEDLYEGTERAPVLGITGPPGVGKSTLVDELIEQYRSDDLRVAVVAVDPTSPFSGGAILGDRVRMQRHSEDRGVFIRSMSTKGELGGLNSSIYDVVIALSHYEFDLVILETVGVGQGEVEISRCSDYTALMMVAAYGDSIQLIKAGVQEIADCFVINKIDRYEPDQLEADLRKLSDDPDGLCMYPISAETGEGIDDLSEHLWSKVVSNSRDDDQRRTVGRHHLEGLLREQIEGWVTESIDNNQSGRSNPYRRRRELIEEWQQRQENV